MGLRVKVSARAAREVRSAAQWWADNRPAAPGAVAIDFGETVALLAEQPGIGATYEGTRVPGVRRLFLGPLGYFVYHRVEQDELQILAFWHASRNDQPRV